MHALEAAAAEDAFRFLPQTLKGHRSGSIRMREEFVDVPSESKKASIRASANELRSARDGETARQNDGGRLAAEVDRALVTPAPKDVL